jgi:hypothetical protein
VVLLILAMVWAVVLGPSLIRRRAERRANNSIGDFHRQLRILERTGPSVVSPAHRLDVGERLSSGPFLAPGSYGGTGAQRRPDPYFRPEACKRRRDILLVLVCVLVGTGLLGAIPALRPALFVTIAGAVSLAVYVGLLVYLRTLALEREMKLRYLPPPMEHVPSVVVRRIASR